MSADAHIIEKGWISRGIVREDTKFFDTCYLFRTWEGTFRVKDEIGCLLPFVTAARPLLIQSIKPTMVHSDRFLLRSIGRALGRTDRISRVALLRPEELRSL